MLRGVNIVPIIMTIRRQRVGPKLNMSDMICLRAQETVSTSLASPYGKILTPLLSHIHKLGYLSTEAINIPNHAGSDVFCCTVRIMYVGQISLSYSVLHTFYRSVCIISMTLFYSNWLNFGFFCMKSRILHAFSQQTKFVCTNGCFIYSFDWFIYFIYLFTTKLITHAESIMTA